MSHWNYRVMQRRDEDSEEIGYVLVDAYYDDNSQLSGTSTGRCSPFGKTPEKLKEDLELMQGAFDRPVLSEDWNNG